MKTLLLRTVLPLAALAFIAPASAAVQKGSGTPTSPTVIPAGTFDVTYVISQPGSYVLGGSRHMSDATKNIIEITAPDVTLDLAGFAVSHPGGSSNEGNGISIPAPENVELRNGSIVNAAKWGLVALAGKGLRIIDVRVMSARLTGILSETASTHVDRCDVADAGTYGIIAMGAGSLVTDCVISDSGFGLVVLNTGRAVRTIVRGGQTGIFLAGSSTAVDCAATGASTQGFYASVDSTLRNVESMNNSVGITSANATVFITGSRITGNGTAVNGTHTSGGGNMIQ